MRLLWAFVVVFCGWITMPRSSVAEVRRKMEAVIRVVAPEGDSALAAFIHQFNEHATKVRQASSGKQCRFPSDFLSNHCAGLADSLRRQNVVCEGDVNDFLVNFDFVGDQLTLRAHWPWRTAPDSPNGVWRRTTGLGTPGAAYITAARSLGVARRVALCMLHADMFQQTSAIHKSWNEQLARQLLDVIEKAQFSKSTKFTPPCTHTRPVLLCSNRTELRQPVVLLGELLATTSGDAWKHHFVAVADNNKKGLPSTVAQRELLRLPRWQLEETAALDFTQGVGMANVSVDVCRAVVRELGVKERLITLPAAIRANAEQAKRVWAKHNISAPPDKRKRVPAAVNSAATSADATRPPNCESAQKVRAARHAVKQSINNRSATMGHSERASADKICHVLDELLRGTVNVKTKPASNTAAAAARAARAADATAHDDEEPEEDVQEEEKQEEEEEEKDEDEDDDDTVASLNAANNEDRGRGNNDDADDRAAESGANIGRLFEAEELARQQQQQNHEQEAQHLARDHQLAEHQASSRCALQARVMPSGGGDGSAAPPYLGWRQQDQVSAAARQAAHLTVIEQSVASCAKGCVVVVVVVVVVLLLLLLFLSFLLLLSRSTCPHTVRVHVFACGHVCACVHACVPTSSTRPRTTLFLTHPRWSLQYYYLIIAQAGRLGDSCFRSRRIGQTRGATAANEAVRVGTEPHGASIGLRSSCVFAAVEQLRPCCRAAAPAYGFETQRQGRRFDCATSGAVCRTLQQLRGRRGGGRVDGRRRGDGEDER